MYTYGVYTYYLWDVFLWNILKYFGIFQNSISTKLLLFSLTHTFCNHVPCNLGVYGTCNIGALKFFQHAGK